MNEPTDPTLPTPTAAPVPAQEYTLEPGRAVWRNGKPFLVLFRDKANTQAEVADAAAHQIVALLNDQAARTQATELLGVMRDTLARANGTGSDGQLRKHIRDTFPDILELFK